MLLDAPFIEDDWRAMMVPVDGSGETQWTQWWQLSVLEKVDFSR